MSQNEKPQMIPEQKICTEENPQSTKYKTYKYRWLILFLFVLVSFSSAFQWPMYVIIDNVIENYYQVSLPTVNWTATVFLLCYVLFLSPATYVVEKLGIRFAVLLGATGPFVASLIKLLAVHSDRFWMLMLSQTIIAITQTSLSFLPASLAAVWFGPTQVSTACSIATSGIQIGTAIGCIIPATLFDGAVNVDQVENIFHKLNRSVAILCGVTLAVTVLLFKTEPPTPPSQTRSNLRETKVNLRVSLKQVKDNTSYILFWVTYSSNIGMLFAISFLLNPTILQYYPNNISDIGRLGLLFLFFGVIGSAVFGVILDKFKRFKETTLAVSAFCAVCMVMYTFTLSISIVYVYIFQSAMGFFLGAFTSIGLEVGAEITYPVPETVSSGLLLSGAKIFGIVFTTFFSYLFSNGFGIWTLFSMSGVVALSTLLLLFTPFELKRQLVNTSVKQTGVVMS